MQSQSITHKSWRTKLQPKGGEDVTDRCFPLYLSVLYLSFLFHVLILFSASFHRV